MKSKNGHRIPPQKKNIGNNTYCEDVLSHCPAKIGFRVQMVTKFALYVDYVPVVELFCLEHGFGDESRG